MTAPDTVQLKSKLASRVTMRTRARVADTTSKTAERFPMT